MPWVTAKLRGNKVYARVGPSGSLEGTVEIRYKLGDARAYRAQGKNLEVVAGAPLPDDAFPEGVFAEKNGAAKTNGGGKAAAKVAHENREIPATSYVAYTDGACSGNPGPAGSGMVVTAPGGGETKETFEYLGIGTNNIAELTAIMRAAEQVPDDAPLVIHTDSSYAIGVLSKGWKAKANQELILRIKATLARRDPPATLVYVPGHLGVAGNERADELAREAIRTRQSRLG